MHGCGEDPAEPKGENDTTASRSPRLGLWLAKKGELIKHESAAFDLVMTAWFDPEEAADIRDWDSVLDFSNFGTLRVVERSGWCEALPESLGELSACKQKAC